MSKGSEVDNDLELRIHRQIELLQVGNCGHSFAGADENGDCLLCVKQLHELQIMQLNQELIKATKERDELREIAKVFIRKVDQHPDYAITAHNARDRFAEALDKE